MSQKARKCAACKKAKATKSWQVERRVEDGKPKYVSLREIPKYVSLWEILKRSTD